MAFGCLPAQSCWNEVGDDRRDLLYLNNLCNLVVHVQYQLIRNKRMWPKASQAPRADIVTRRVAVCGEFGGSER